MLLASQLNTRVLMYEYLRGESEKKLECYKREVVFQVDEMDCFVAPTFINLESPTFWLPANYLVNLRTDKSLNMMENLLRKIIEASKINLSFEFYDEKHMDVLKARTTIDILVSVLSLITRSSRKYRLGSLDLTCGISSTSCRVCSSSEERNRQKRYGSKKRA